MCSKREWWTGLRGSIAGDGILPVEARKQIVHYAEKVNEVFVLQGGCAVSYCLPSHGVAYSRMVSEER